MQLQEAKLLVTDADLATALARVPPGNVSALSGTIQADGIHISGTYHYFVPVPFETVWAPRVQGESLCFTLASLRAIGIPLNVLQGAVMGALKSAVQNQPRLSFSGQTVFVDLSQPYVTFTLTGVSLSDGQLLISA